jgi:hypothetical protein
MKQLSLIFLTGFAQVFLVSANIWFISRLNWAGIGICGFGISYLWTINVRKINKGSLTHQLVYSLGATLGGLSGVMMAKTIRS